MSYLEYRRFEETPLVREPFSYLIVPGFVLPEALPVIAADFPDIPRAGSYPTSGLTIAGHFKNLLEELNGARFREAIERKFEIDLARRPLMVSIRGQLRRKDGAIHTDSKTKLITVLLYLNEAWEAEGGRLRLLRTGKSLDDPIAEIAPCGGALLAFRRSDESWHGHKPHIGPRRVIQLNWVANQEVAERESRRHLFTAWIKQLARFGLVWTFRAGRER
jgi:hypothetical protein